MYLARFRKSDLGDQSIYSHIKEVARLSEVFGKVTGLANTAALSGLLHDMGKYSDSFQRYISELKIQNRNGLGEEWISKNKKVDHGKYGAIYIIRNFHQIGGTSKLLAEIIAMIVCYHHGGLEDFLLNDESKIYNRINENVDESEYVQVTERFFEDFKEDLIYSLFKGACKEFEHIINKFKVNNMNKYYHIHLLIKHLYSILIDADRINARCFDEGSEYEINATEKLWIEYARIMEQKVEVFRGMNTATELEENIKLLRLDISDSCVAKADIDNGTYMLTVPTGGGKTLSSLRFALNHAKIRHKDRIIYILPFTTIIEQNAKAVAEALGSDENILEHHSNVLQENENEQAEYDILTESWDSPIIFTTMVQFLDSIYSGGTRNIRRLHNLSNSIIIFDEIQALPTKCISIFNEAVNYLCFICNCTSILCSATQPKLYDTKKPIITKGELIKNTTDIFNKFKRVEVINKTNLNGYSYGDVSGLVSQIYESSKSILIILNTTKSVKNFFEVLKERNFGCEIYHLSTKLCPAHRKTLITEIREKLKKKEPIICVSTQLIEAGVDISFETVIRNIAGFDSIAQAAGRCNRNGTRPIGYCYIINLNNENLNSLPDIKLGITHSEAALWEYENCRKAYDNYLLSPILIKKYYDYFYNDEDIREKMDYPVEIEKESISIYEMLTTERSRSDAFRKLTGKEFGFKFNFQFKRASDAFNVIEEKTISILVPYEEGKTLISELLSDSARKKDKRKLMRKVQQYSVSIYENEKKELVTADALVFHKDYGLYLLVDGFYDKECGINPKKKMGFINA